MSLHILPHLLLPHAYTVICIGGAVLTMWGVKPKHRLNDLLLILCYLFFFLTQFLRLYVAIILGSEQFNTVRDSGDRFKNASADKIKVIQCP